MNHIPLMINGKQLCEIFAPEEVAAMDAEEQISYSLMKRMYPTSVTLTSETYSRNAERTLNYELNDFSLVNRKAKPEFTWDLLKYEYVLNLFKYLNYSYDFKNEEGDVVPRNADFYTIVYYDLSGQRSITAYLGQTITGTLVEYDGELYVQDLRIAFPER